MPPSAAVEVDILGMKIRRPDYALLGITLLLVVFGLTMIASASVNLSQENFQQNYYYLKNQLWHGLLPGLILGLIAYLLPYPYLKKLSLPLLALTILGLILVFVPGLGTGYGGAHRWLKISSYSFQPSEFLKLSFVIYLASWFSAKGKSVKNFSQGLIPFIILTGIMATLLLLQPDLGTMGVVGLSAVIVYFLAGAPFTHLGLIAGGAVVLFFFLIKFFN